MFIRNTDRSQVDYVLYAQKFQRKINVFSIIDGGVSLRRQDLVNYLEETIEKLNFFNGFTSIIKTAEHLIIQGQDNFHAKSASLAIFDLNNGTELITKNKLDNIFFIQDIGLDRNGHICLPTYFGFYQLIIKDVLFKNYLKGMNGGFNSMRQITSDEMGNVWFIQERPGKIYRALNDGGELQEPMVFDIAKNLTIYTGSSWEIPSLVGSQKEPLAS